MRRRTYLSVTGAGLAALAGCAGGSGDGGDGGLDVSCDDIVPDADVTVCADDEGGPLSISHQPEQWTVNAGDGDREPIDVTVHNDGEDALRFDAPGWTLKRQTKQGWTDVATGDGEYEALEPGESFTWSLAESGRTEAGTAPADTAWEVVESQSGVHAFVVAGELGDRTAAAGAAFQVVWHTGEQGTANL